MGGADPCSVQSATRLEGVPLSWQRAAGLSNETPIVFRRYTGGSGSPSGGGKGSRLGEYLVLESNYKNVGYL